MKIRVSNATNTQLDWLVAKCEGKNGVLHDDGITRCIVIAAASGVYKGTFKPTVNWCQGGPIIERELIALNIQRVAAKLVFEASMRLHDRHGSRVTWVKADGPTPLIAAMRCFVASKLGGEVEVPEGLL